MADGDDHLFVLDQLVHVDLATIIDDLCAAGIAELFFYLGQFSNDDRINYLCVSQDSK